MAKLNLENMSIEEIISRLGIDVGKGIKKEELLTVVKDSVLIRKNLEHLSINLENIDPVEFLLSYSKYVDQGKLVLCIARNALQDLGSQSITKKQFQPIYINSLKLLENVYTEIPIFEKENGYTQVKKFFTTDELFGKAQSTNKLKQSNLEALEQLDESGLLLLGLTMITKEDYEDLICYYPGNSNVIEYTTFMNTQMQVKKLEKMEPNLTEKQRNEEIENFKIIEERDFLLQHPEKFDIDKMLLLIACRAKFMAIEGEKRGENYSIATKLMEIASENIHNEKCKIQGKILLDPLSEKEYVSYSIKDLREDVLRIIDDRYYSKEKIAEDKKMILQGDKKLEEISNKEYLKLLGFLPKEKDQLVEQNPKNLEYLVNHQMLEPHEIRQYLSQIEQTSLDQFFVDSLYENGVIGKADIVEMYMKNNMDFSYTISMNEEHDLQPEITVEAMIEYYEAMKKDKQKTKDFDRYTLLFREIKLKEKSKEVQEGIAEQIAMQICESDTEYEDFKNLYKANLLPIKTLIEWNGEDIIYDLIKKDSLKPKDAKQLLMTGKLNLPKVYQTLENSDLSEEQKLSFIYSSFNNLGETPEQIKAQKRARDYLIQGIDIENELKGIGKSKDGIARKTRNNNQPKVERNKYVSDPIHRWELFAALDENCKISLYKDGTAKVSLPTLNQVIMEKFFKYVNGEKRFNYGAATYIMSQEEFDRNKENIIQEEKVNRKELIKMHESGTADKLVHSSNWGKALKVNLNISIENDYSQEKTELIDDLVDQIEKARELIH